MFFATTVPFPSELNKILEPLLSPYGVDKKVLDSLWHALAKERGQQKERHYSSQKKFAEAYAAYYLPANLLKPAFIMEEAFLTDNLSAEESYSWLDLGTGPGTAFWGLAWWCYKRGKKLTFHGWDQSKHFIHLAESLTQNKPFGFQPRFHISQEKEDWIKLANSIKPTHISFLNSLSEIFPEEKAREKSINMLLAQMRSWKATDGKERYLLLAEPAAQNASRELSRLKDSLNTKILLPCTDNRSCGALVKEADWCHEEVAVKFPPWHEHLGGSIGLKKESALFSYLLCNANKAEANSDEWFRMVSQRMEHKGQVECFFCTKEGKIKARVQRSKVTDGNAFFLSLQRGALLKNAQLKEKGDVERASLFSSNIPSIFD